MYHFYDDYRWQRAFLHLYICIMDGNVANGLTFMLSFTVTHRDNVNAKIYAPNMAAPQTGAYLALRHILLLLVSH